MPYGGEKVIFEQEEVARIKKFDSPGELNLNYLIVCLLMQGLDDF